MHKAAQVHASLNYLVAKMGVEDNRIVGYGNISLDGKSDSSILNAVRAKFGELDCANIRTEKVSFHASINPTEDELQRLDIMDICKEYMKRLGYENQPYIVVEHNDTGRRHYHIISHRVQPNGKKINDYNEIRKTNNYAQELSRVVRQSQLKGENICPLHYSYGRRGNKKLIAEIVKDASGYRYDNIFELQKILLDRHIELVERDGYYIAAGTDGIKRTRAVKVELPDARGRDTMYIGKRTKERICNIVKTAMEHSMTELHARNILARHQLGVQFLRNAEGRIYGVYYIDHKNRLIVKGSSLSKDVAASLWDVKQEKWNRLQYLPLNDYRHTYGCLSREMANVFLYNRWSSGHNQAYKDLYYSSIRENNRRVI